MVLQRNNISSILDAAALSFAKLNQYLKHLNRYIFENYRDPCFAAASPGNRILSIQYSLNFGLVPGERGSRNLALPEWRDTNTEKILLCVSYRQFLQ